MTGPRELVHGERESFIGRYRWQRSEPGVGIAGRNDVGEGEGAHDSHNRSPSASTTFAYGVAPRLERKGAVVSPPQARRLHHLGRFEYRRRCLSQRITRMDRTLRIMPTPRWS